MRWAGHVALMGERRGVYRVLVRNLGAYRPLGRPRRRWEDNVEFDLQKVGWGFVDWVYLTHYRDSWRALVIAVINFLFPQNTDNFLTS